MIVVMTMCCPSAASGRDIHGVTNDSSLGGGPSAAVPRRRSLGGGCCGRGDTRSMSYQVCSRLLVSGLAGQQ